MPLISLDTNVFISRKNMIHFPFSATFKEKQFFFSAVLSKAVVVETEGFSYACFKVFIFGF